MVVALDLEATLIDNAIQGNPRPGLYAFIEFCQEHFRRVALFTTVEESAAREVLYRLADIAAIPDSFTLVEYIHWDGQYKDLRFAKDAVVNDVLFVDDDESWVHPEQIDQWVKIEPWNGASNDRELSRVCQALKQRLI